MPLGAGALSGCRGATRADELGLAHSANLVISCRAAFRGPIRGRDEFVTTTQEDIMQTADIIARDLAAYGAALPTASTRVIVAG